MTCWFCMIVFGLVLLILPDGSRGQGGSCRPKAPPPGSLPGSPPPPSKK